MERSLNILDFKKYNEYSHSHYGHGFRFAHLYKQLTDGNLLKEGELQIENGDFKLELKVHQRRLLHEILMLERNDFRTGSGINYGCICDKVGSGKSIVVLAHISNHKQLNHLSDNINKKDNQLFSDNYNWPTGFTFEEDKVIDSNLIVVPHGIFHQWEEYIKKFTKLSYLKIHTNKSVSDVTIEILNSYDIILVKSTRYNGFVEKVNDLFNCSHNSHDRSYEFNKFGEKTSLLSKFCEDIRSDLRNYKGLDGTMDKINSLRDLLNNHDLNQQIQKDIVENKDNVKTACIFKGPVFQRVFIDEADSINIPRCGTMYGKFNWFITSSVGNLLFPRGFRHWQSGLVIAGIKRTGFIIDTFRENSRFSFHNQFLYLKNTDQFIIDSFNLPDPVINKIECYTPPHLSAVYNVADPKVMSALNAGDINTAVELLGCNITSEEDIADVVVKKLMDKKAALTDKLIEKNTMLLKIEQELVEKENLLGGGLMENVMGLSVITAEIEDGKRIKNNLKASIKNYNEKMEDLDFKIKSLQERVSNIGNKSCPVCLDDINNPVMINCCKNIFCFECLSESFKHVKKCPYCRCPGSAKDFVLIGDKKHDTKNHSNPKKLDKLIDIIKQKPDGTFLVFSEYDNTFNNIKDSFIENNITFNNLVGTGARIKKVITEFNDKKTKVLLLNAKHYGAGLNLQSCSDIIIYHRMDKFLEKQVIGRGQRPGREGILNVNYLCYSHEL
jgi:SNF2 family DNA or RNA helicase